MQSYAADSSPCFAVRRVASRTCITSKSEIVVQWMSLSRSIAVSLSWQPSGSLRETTGQKIPRGEPAGSKMSARGNALLKGVQAPTLPESVFPLPLHHCSGLSVNSVP